MPTTWNTLITPKRVKTFKVFSSSGSNRAWIVKDANTSKIEVYLPSMTEAIRFVEEEGWILEPDYQYA